LKTNFFFGKSFFVLIFLLLFVVNATASPGNVDGFGDVDLKDVVMSLQVTAGINPANVSLDGDVNNDGAIGLAEAVFGLQAVAQIRQIAKTWYKDSDGDGYSDGTSIVSDTRPSDDYFSNMEIIATSGDVDDGNPDIFPVGAPTEFARVLSSVDASGAEWTAEPNPVSVLSKEDRGRYLGALIPPDLENRSKRRYSLRENLPASLDWRNNNGNFVSPVKDQGYCGSCWAFATVGALESQILMDSDSLDLDLSEQILVSCSSAGDCGGGYLHLASDFLQNMGTSAESCHPYSETNGACANGCTNWENSAFRIDSWHDVNNTVSDLKAAIYANGPLVTTMAVYSDFYSYSSGVYSYSFGPLEGYHAVVLVGWDDSQQCFIVKNSWGTWWGDNGYFRIAYSEVTGASEFGAWTIAYTRDEPCGYEVSTPSRSVSASSGSGTFGVTAGVGCSWSAVSNENWISVTSGSSGTGNGTVSYSFSQNPSASSRTGTVYVEDEAFLLTQAGLSCTYAISPQTNSVPGTGGTGGVSIDSPNGCDWTAKSNASWITITSPSSGTGDGEIAYSIPSNNGSSRTGTLTISGQEYTVTQAANCTYSLSGASTTLPASGGSGDFGVTTFNGCSWTASSNASWINIDAGSSGTGSGTVSFTAASNAGTTSRTGIITAGGRTHSVTQSGACAYTISQASTIAAAGGTGTVDVTTSSSCSWTATSSANWITITTGTSGSGNGVIAYSVAPNGDGARSGFLNVAGQASTLISQLGACSFAISPASDSISASGGSGSVSVSAQSGCTPSASSNAGWITVTSVGGTSVSYSVAQNTGAARTGTLTIGGRTFSLTQSGGTATVYFPDPNLEAVVRETINKPTGDIFLSDLEIPVSLNGYARDIQNIEGLQHLVNLNWLELSYNRISDIGRIAELTNLSQLFLAGNGIEDIGPVSGLQNLAEIDLEGNQIADISALVNNAGIGSGDTVWVQNNPLSATSCDDYVPQLEGRGVAVTHYCKPSEPVLYTGRIPDSGQTKCYDESGASGTEISCEGTGQDGEFLINKRSYTKLDANGNDLPDSAINWSMVRDNVTGLIWEVKQYKDGNPNYSNPHDADNVYTWYNSSLDVGNGDELAGVPGEGTDTEDYINAVNENNFGGHSDWRLPTLKELAALADLQSYYPAINSFYFPSTNPATFWSSTTRTSPFAGSAWGVTFVSGSSIVQFKSSSYHIRAVRGGRASSTDSLIINSLDSVTDIHAGLMWVRGEGVRMTWREAISYCASLVLDGHDDWRLPNLNELRSIVDYSTYNPSIMRGNSPNLLAFPEVYSERYWSSTSAATSFMTSYNIDFYYGSNGGGSKALTLKFRPVRGGQPSISNHLFIRTPQQASHWTIGDTMPITWDTQNITGNVTISLSRDGGKTFPEVIASGIPNSDAAFTWVVTGPASVNCALKVEPASDPSKGTVQSLFTIE
jgi:C1A family cysteine protease